MVRIAAIFVGFSAWGMAWGERAEQEESKLDVDTASGFRETNQNIPLKKEDSQWDRNFGCESNSWFTNDFTEEGNKTSQQIARLQLKSKEYPGVGGPIRANPTDLKFTWTIWQYQQWKTAFNAEQFKTDLLGVVGKYLEVRGDGLRGLKTILDVSAYDDCVQIRATSPFLAQKVFWCIIEPGVPSDWTFFDISKDTFPKMQVWKEYSGQQTFLTPYAYKRFDTVTSENKYGAPDQKWDEAKSDIQSKASDQGLPDQNVAELKSEYDTLHSTGFKQNDMDQCKVKLSS